MRIAGIIAEYNPFHNGHAWQIEQLRRRGFDAVVCVCSPGVVQRGEPAMLPTAVRTAAALAGGADLVLSLPAPYAVLSSEGFAAAGVALLTALGCVDTLCFGVEMGRTERIEDEAGDKSGNAAGNTAVVDTAEELMYLAALLEGPEFAPALRAQLNAGLPLPAARAAAAEELCPGAGAILRQGNALLGVDYCRAILRQKSSLVPLALPRMGAAHDAPLAAGATETGESANALQPERGSAAQNGCPPLRPEQAAPEKNIALRSHMKTVSDTAASFPQYASASALRTLAGREGAAALAPYVPEACFTIYRQAEAEGAWLDAAAFSAAALSRLRTLSARELRTVRGAAEGLEHRLAAAVYSAGTWDVLIDTMKTKRYATARLRRFALSAVLGYSAAPGHTAPPDRIVSPSHIVPQGHTPAAGDTEPLVHPAGTAAGALSALPPYLHVLGANEAGRAVLGAAKETARLPLSHSLARLAKTSTQAAAVAAAHAAAEDFTALCLRRPAPMGSAYTAKAQFLP